MRTKHPKLLILTAVAAAAFTCVYASIPEITNTYKSAGLGIGWKSTLVSGTFSGTLPNGYNYSYTSPPSGVTFAPTYTQYGDHTYEGYGSIPANTYTSTESRTYGSWTVLSPGDSFPAKTDSTTFFTPNLYNTVWYQLWSEGEVW